jgi:hypothetical protein
MAINDFLNIENINLNLDSTAQLVASKDLTIFKTGAKNITDFGMSSNDVIEFRVYDISNNLLQQTGGINVRYIHKDVLPKYLLKTTDTITQELIYNIDVEKLIYEAGYGNGQFKVSFNFLKNYLGNEDPKQKVWIHEVSPSRTEIRVMPLLGNDFKLNQHITHRYNSFLDKSNELREVINIIENTIDSFENNISNLIDNYFVSKHGQIWLDKITSDYKFNNLTYTAFKQKIYSDFRNLLFTSLDTFDLNEYYTTNEIYTLIDTKLIESIELNATSIAQYDIPQIIKDYTKTKVDSQILQSLLNTNYTAKSNLTQNDKLGTIKADVIIDTTPPVKPPIVPPVEYVITPQPTPVNGGSRGGGGDASSRNPTMPGNYNNNQFDGPFNQQQFK